MRKIWIKLFKLPLLLLGIVSFLASIYVAIKGTYGIGFTTPIILGIILLLYFIAVISERKNKIRF